MPPTRFICNMNFIKTFTIASLVLFFVYSCSLQGPIGPAGENGKDGSTIISGRNSPVSNEGEIGDYYIDSLNSLIYGPKISTRWGAGRSLKGNPGKFTIKQGILYAGDTTSEGNWDIVVSAIDDSSVVQCLVRQNQGYMWMTPTWCLSKDNYYVRIIRNLTAVIGYEYQITVINP